MLFCPNYGKIVLNKETYLNLRKTFFNRIIVKIE